MLKVQYQSKGRGPLWRPVFDKEAEAELLEGSTGFCLGCGAESSGIEPDARQYKCENCEQLLVYGLEELLLKGLLR